MVRLMKIPTAAMAAGALLAAALTLPAVAETDDFFGTWSNVNRDTRDITSITINADKHGPNMHVFGRCHPDDCDWGKVEAFIYTNTVGGDPFRDGQVLTGAYNSGFARKLVILRRLSEYRLRYEVLNHFTDGSNRSDYYTSGELARER
jgi:hypothetical protein